MRCIPVPGGEARVRSNEHERCSFTEHGGRSLSHDTRRAPSPPPLHAPFPLCAQVNSPLRGKRTKLQALKHFWNVLGAQRPAQRPRGWRGPFMWDFVAAASGEGETLARHLLPLGPGDAGDLPAPGDQSPKVCLSVTERNFLQHTDRSPAPDRVRDSSSRSAAMTPSTRHHFIPEQKDIKTNTLRCI